MDFDFGNVLAVLTFIFDIDLDVIANDLVRKSEFSSDGTHSH